MPSDLNLLTVFVTGLLAGGFTCVAVQGGLLASALVQNKELRAKNLEQSTTQNIVPVLVFIISKLVAYTLLGFFLGWVGSLFQISLQMRILLQFAVVVFMLGTALNLLNAHPFFRYFLVNPPRFLVKKVYKKSEDSRLLPAGRQVFAAALLGFLTVFIPCGATQAMMALSVGTGQPLTGALIMFVFVLGTSPVFLLLGLLTIRLGTFLKGNFTKAAAYILILFSLFNLDAALALANSPVTIRSAVNRFYCLVSFCDYDLSLNPVSEQTIIFSPTGYSPNRFAVRKGERVTLQLVNENASGCIQSFAIAALNIQKIVLPNESVDISFVAPNEPGRINFTCSQGLYPGTIEVI